ncbi:MAG: relaxase/mobilization nuclease domain-containing protein [Gordonia sp. (in: high G+C Gram-positive bacteria)]|uniref:relaxase/mobilization nuclease domain-containing protein n=1 Tax=Gordonia sp. (in: high G+C Gram-positive bacteria) TaxID=84139 RepID=UPI003C71FB7A
MSIVKAEPARAITGPIMYVIVGKVRKRDQVFRPVAFRSDFTMLPPGIAAGEETARVAEEMFAPYSKRRPRKGILLTQSFSPDEFDRSNPEHQQRVLELAYELAKRVAPGAPCVVGVHADRNHLHAHIFVLNHDTQTVRALRKGFVYGDVKSINDELMAENGLLVAEPGEVSKTKEGVWLRRRGVEIPDHTGLDHLDVTEENWQAWVRDEVDRVLDDDSIDSMASFKKRMRARGVDVRFKKPSKTNPKPALSFAVLDDAGRVRRFESSGGKTYKMSRGGSIFGTDYTYQAIESSIVDRQKEIQDGQGRATEEVAGASVEAVGGELRSDAGAAAGTGTRAYAGGGDVAVPAAPTGGDAGIRRFAGGDGFDHEGDRQAPGRRKAPVVAGRGDGEDQGERAGTPRTVAGGRLNASIERKAARHRTRTDEWIDDVAERVEDRLDRDVQVAARRISQSQSLMEGLAWLLVLYVEQRQQADALRAWATEKRDAMAAPVERPADGPLASLSDDALRFLSTHEEGAARGYEQFAQERYEAYADRKRSAGETPQSMDAYYGTEWGDAVRVVRGEQSHLGSLPRPATAFLREHGEPAEYLVWRATYFRPASTGTPPDTAPAAVRQAAAGGVPEFAAYLAATGRIDAYAEFAAEQFKRVQARRGVIGEYLFYSESVDEHRARTGTGNPPSGGFTKTRELGED